MVGYQPKTDDIWGFFRDPLGVPPPIRVYQIDCLVKTFRERNPGYFPLLNLQNYKPYRWEASVLVPQGFEISRYGNTPEEALRDLEQALKEAVVEYRWQKEHPLVFG